MDPTRFALMDRERVSGMAIRHCMDALGFTDLRRQSYKASATLRYPGSKQSLGNLSLSFDVRNPADFPEINCDPVIRSFGIYHENFTSRFQTFEFNAHECELRIIGNENEYDFILSFHP